MLAFFITILTASFVGFCILVKLSYVQTPQYKSKIIAGFGGEFKRATEAGLSWKTPILERVVNEVDLTLQAFEFDVNIKTQNDNFIDVPVQIHYEIADPLKAARLPEERRKSVMQALAQNVIRSHFAEGDLQRIFASRTEMAINVQNELAKSMLDYGLFIRDVVVDNPKLPMELRDSMQGVVIADRKMEAAKKNAEAVKVTMVAQAEGEQALLTAKALGEKARLMAQAEGEGAIRVAQAQAEKTARLLLGEGVGGEQMAIAEGFEKSVENMKKAGISGKDAMDYLMQTNILQYGKQNIEAISTAYSRIPNALLIADVLNPSQYVGKGNIVSELPLSPSGVGGGSHDLKELMKIIAAMETVRPLLQANPAPSLERHDSGNGSGLVS
jgi:regulator of protease activity HflC (stomatin/prohibitin superfamily)